MAGRRHGTTPRQMAEAGFVRFVDWRHIGPSSVGDDVPQQCRPARSLSRMGPPGWRKGRPGLAARCSRVGNIATALARTLPLQGTSRQPAAGRFPAIVEPIDPHVGPDLRRGSMSQQAKLVDDDRRHGCDWLTWTMPYRESRL